MKRVLAVALSAMITTSLFAQSQSGAAATSSGSAQATAKTRRKKTSSSATDEKLKAISDALASQQQQIQSLQQDIQRRDQVIEQLQQQLQQTQAAASDAKAKADTAAPAQDVNALKSDVADLKTNTTNIATTMQETQKAFGDAEHPTAIHFKGITITPGGFIEAAGVVRNRNENASINSATGDSNIPFSGTANGQLSEFRFDARQSRLTLKGEGTVGPAHVTGYYEVDFLGAAPTANENQSNSFNLRQRQLWGQVKFTHDLIFTGGQQWSLYTTERKGMENLNEFIPLTINAQYVIGHDWARQPGFRIVKGWGNKVWAGFAVENTSTVLAAQSFGSAAPALVTTAAPSNNITLGDIPVFGFNNSANAISPSGLFTLANTPGANGVSTNLAPNLIAKLTFEPGWGHFELKGMATFFRDRYMGVNNTSTGGALGFAAILPIIKNTVDLIGEGTFGNGIGRYGSGGGFDVTLRNDGNPIPLRSYHALVGPEIHVGKKLDIYAYAGGEYYQRTAYFLSPTSAIGYGLPLATNSNCNSSEQTTTTAPTGKCNGQLRVSYELTPGFWYRFYKGTAGTLQWGVQYSYSNRTLWVDSKGLQPSANISQIYTSFRYYLP